MSGPPSPIESMPRRVSFSQAPPSPLSPPLSSLQAAAVLNAGLHRTPSARMSAGRRSSLSINLALNDPTLPGPGELQQSSGGGAGSPRLARRGSNVGPVIPSYPRKMSLGELHQELETEQEAQVNRLLRLVRVQQDQLAALQKSQHDYPPSPTFTDYSHRPTPVSNVGTPASAAIIDGDAHSHSATGAAHGYFSRPGPLSRLSSAWMSSTNDEGETGSSLKRPTLSTMSSVSEDYSQGLRYGSTFYQAEAQTLVRENQILRARVQELGE